METANKKASNYGSARHIIIKPERDRTDQEKAEMLAFLNTWLTPKEISQHFDADIDPACPPNMPWRTAKVMFTEKDDGLAQHWPSNQFVFMNPPYNRKADGTSLANWMTKLATQGNGVGLVFANTDCRWFHEQVFSHPNCTGVLWLKGRVKFQNLKGETLAQRKPSALIAYGPEAIAKIKTGLEEGVLRGTLQIIGRAPIRLRLAA